MAKHPDETGWAVWMRTAEPDVSFPIARSDTEAHALELLYDIWGAMGFGPGYSTYRGLVNPQCCMVVEEWRPLTWGWLVPPEPYSWSERNRQLA